MWGRWRWGCVGDSRGRGRSLWGHIELSPLVRVVRDIGTLGIVRLTRQGGNVVGRLRLEVECDESISHQVLYGVEALLSDIMLAIVVELEVLGDSFKPRKSSQNTFTSHERK